MAFDFPASPTPGQIFAPAGGPTYTWNGTAWGANLSPVATAEARNRIVNGAMQISQENPINATLTAVGSYAADQWPLSYVTSGAIAFVLINDPPAGNLVRLQTTTADTSLVTTDCAYTSQKIEGTNIADFLWGTANAKPAVLRFTARANIASLVVGVAVRNIGGTRRSFVKNVTLTPLYQDFVIPIPPCPDGTWPTDTAPAVEVSFAVMCGPTYTGSVENTWLSGNFVAAPGIGNMMSVVGQAAYFTNVGLYLDPNSTGLPPPWQRPDEAQELRACQRYWQALGYLSFISYAANAGMNVATTITFPSMRIAPTAAVIAAGALGNCTAPYNDVIQTHSLRLGAAATAAGAVSVTGRHLGLSARM